MTRLMLATCLLGLLVGGVHAADRLPAVQYDFDAFDAGEWYKDWTRGDPSQVSRVAEGGVTFVRLQRSEPGATMIERSLPIDASWKSLLVSARLRGKDIKTGGKSYETPLVQVIFFDAGGQQVGGWPAKLQVPLDTDWHVQRQRYVLPEGAATVRLQLWLINSSGVFDVDWLKVQPLREGELPDATDQPLSWDFEGLGPRWPEGWTRGDPALVSIAEENGNHFLRIDRKTKEQSAIISREVYLDPTWPAVTVSARVRASGLDKGEQVWMTGNVQITFKDSSGKQVGGWPKKLDVQADCDWSPREHRYEVPAGAAVLEIAVGMWAAAGRFDVDDLVVTPHKPGELPGGEKPRWGEEPAVALGEHRGEMVLNGLWRFCPATVKNPTDANWGWIRVPSNWQASSGPGVVLRGGGWGDVNLRELPAALYERPFTVPREWSGRSVVLRLDRVSTDAVIFVDGQKAGSIAWPSGEVDLTPLVKPGQQQALRIEVFATAFDEEVLEFMETMDLQVSKKKSSLEARGLIGDVVLASRPREAHLGDVAVRTSVRDKRLTLVLEALGVTTPGAATVRADVIDAATGQLAKSFTAAADLKAAASQRLELSWNWEDPKLWDVDQPNLYQLRLTVNGDGLRDSQLLTFGFREFHVDGRGFVLNGKPIRLRPYLAPNGYFSHDGVPEVVAGRIEGLRKAGFNFLEIWPTDISRRGSECNFDVWYREADRQGILISGVVPSVNTAVVDSSWRPIWESEQGKPAWTKRVEQYLHLRKNHPSVVMWGISGNFFGHPQDQNPRLIGRRDVYPDSKARAAGRDAIETLRGLDPTRVPITHQGSDIGDIHTVNMYLCLIPLQEREEWLSEWAKDGQMPFMPVEFGVPQFNTFLRGRNSFGGNILTEPWLSEYAAIYLGPQAYELETKEYREGMVSRFKNGQDYQSWHAGNEVLWQSPAMQSITRLFVENTWRSWRAWGITGGMIPWDNGYQWKTLLQHDRDVAVEFVPGQRGRHTPTVPLRVLRPYEAPVAALTETGEALQRNNQPTLAFIAGEARQGFTDKDHLFLVGQTVAKQIVLINDAREELPFRGEWRAVVGETQVASGRFEGKLPVAANRFEPFSFALPATIPADTVDGRIELAATIGDRTHADRFDFRVHRPVPSTSSTVLAIDPKGLTTTMLKQVGVEVRPWSGDASGVVVIGREALSDDPAMLGKIEPQVRAGVTAIVFAQTPQTLERYFGFRVSPHLSRRVFPVSTTHPVTKGLDAESLRDWNGASTLVEPYPDLNRPDTKLGASSPYYGWRWGNRGSVATGAIEKPHHSGWTPIIECEFDLAYSPLMELRVGNGRIIWCQLDLEDQLDTPPATRLLIQLLEYAAKPGSRPESVTASYLGGPRDLDLLESIGLDFKPINALPDQPGLLILGGDANVDDAALRSFAEMGGRVLVLSRDVGAAPLGMAIESKPGFLGSLKAPDWSEAAGLSASDLRLRNTLDWSVLSGAAGMSVAADGLLAVQRIGSGVIVFAQLDPRRLPADEKTYFRFSRWRQTRALCQLIANLGGQFHGDRRLFRPVDSVDPFVDLSGDWRAIFTNRIDDPNDGKHPDPGVSDKARALCAADVDDSRWDVLPTPGSWEKAGGSWASSNGEAVFRKTIDVPESMLQRELVLHLGAIDDRDETYVNGVKVGASPEGVDSQWNVERRYPVPAGALKPGRNVIAVRIWDQFGGGGFNGPKLEMRLSPLPREVKHPLYHRDYRSDYPLGDDPYRYYRR
jgi:beta-galactosidase